MPSTTTYISVLDVQTIPSTDIYARQLALNYYSLCRSRCSIPPVLPEEAMLTNHNNATTTANVILLGPYTWVMIDTLYC
jgi:hypothetical protein